jgi:cyclin-dependent kinase 10
MHENYIIHRDLKLSNLLIKHNGNLKIADFGLARHLSFPKNNLTPKLVTLWYRPPEILLNNNNTFNNYSWQSDIWAVGCILCEILDEGQVLFPGKNEINQFNLICKFIGKPNKKNWSDFFLFDNCNKLLDMNKDYDTNFIGKKYGKYGKNCVELIDGMLKWDPKKRISAKEALMNQFFQDLPIMSKNSFAKFQKYL